MPSSAPAYSQLCHQCLSQDGLSDKELLGLWGSDCTTGLNDLKEFWTSIPTSHSPIPTDLSSNLAKRMQCWYFFFLNDPDSLTLPFSSPLITVCRIPTPECQAYIRGWNSDKETWWQWENSVALPFLILSGEDLGIRLWSGLWRCCSQMT